MSTHLDGNVLAGELGELFAVDVTTAIAECASCGRTGAIAQTMVYSDAPGWIARCPACGEIMLRLVRGPGRAWLDLRGTACLELRVGTERPGSAAGQG
jgi:Zn finger protein HypA/HybF involved in hydrogenase expression